MELTPSANAQFKHGERVFAGFEVYEPSLDAAPATTVQAHVRIVDRKTGKIQTELEPLDAAYSIKAGTHVVPSAFVIPTDKLPRGAYRLEVQATDSSGRSTSWHTVDFAIE